MTAPVHWLRPALVCEIAFTSWTEDAYGQLLAAFIGIRTKRPLKALSAAVSRLLTGCAKWNPLPGAAADNMRLSSIRERAATDSPEYQEILHGFFSTDRSHFSRFVNDLL